jgi:hypothetical protein
MTAGGNFEEMYGSGGQILQATPPASNEEPKAIRNSNGDQASIEPKKFDSLEVDKKTTEFDLKTG